MLAHRQLDASKVQLVPHVSMDYGFLGQNEEDALPIIIIRDHASHTTCSHAVPCKGTTGSPYPVRQVAYSIARLGHKKIIFKSDDEPAIVALRNAITAVLRSEYGMDVTPETSG